ncbi:SRPBCC family protein [Desulfonatronum thioautotrophicum]|uniref:SRPBCC family protein n=1 Tax=Desulfonatronum thioautotrophicum TaxID=617001 RepID=UPI0005EB6076|nr:SRPBCC family protein [Desulfonatronum thioautotrophicum]
MLHTLTRSQHLPLSSEQAWSFFSDPANLCRITPSWLDFRMTCPPPMAMYAGQILTYTIRPLPGLCLRWVTEITHVREPDFFVDEQRLGPYRFWHHQHLFQKSSHGLKMTDIVHYALPLGPLGDAAHALWARQRLNTIFDHRQKALIAMFS